MMSSSSQAVKDMFRAQFYPVTPSNLGAVEDNDEGTEPLVTRKRRRAITDAERKALRDYYFDPVNGKPAHKHLREWFLQQYRHLISQSTVSESLSDTFAHLDTGSGRPNMKKQRQAQWTDLEDALFEWQQKMEQKRATVTGDILKEMAATLWQKLPQYAGQEVPRFSTGWLEGFKARHHIKKYRQHGEAGAIDQVAVEEELQEIRETIGPYTNEDMCNMDESALFWKMTPDGTLGTKQSAGRKHEKARITINLACNADGSHKLEPWFIGTAAVPRCFGRSSINIKNFRMVWRGNKKAWMTGKIFKEYLLWFDGKMAGRQVILLIDGFLAHNAGLNLFQEEFPQGLTNTKVVFLPANATSVCQPLDQAIIKAWKAQYRKKWVRFLCSEYGQDKDPLKTINVLQAIRWSIEAWEQDVTRVIIENCWVKARVLSAKYGPRNRGEENDLGWKKLVEEEEDGQRAVNREIEKGICNLARQNRISMSMTIGQFFNF